MCVLSTNACQTRTIKAFGKQSFDKYVTFFCIVLFQNDCRQHLVGGLCTSAGLFYWPIRNIVPLFLQDPTCY